MTPSPDVCADMPHRIPAVFLDRDGVLNEAIVRDGHPFAPCRVEDLVILPDAAASCETLRSMGFALVVVTNQPEIARGSLDPGVLDEMHAVLSGALDLDRIEVCPHIDDDGCSCRKPAPGLLLGAAKDLALDLDRSFMVGDRWRDVEAGRRAGCSTIFIDRYYREQRPASPDVIVSCLAEAVSWISSRQLARGTMR